MNALNKEVTVADIEPRLSRIENKLDSLSDAVINLARIEERMITLFNRMDAYDARQTTIWDRIGLISDRIVDLEKTSMTIRTIEKLGYIIASAAAASFFWWLQGGG